MEREISTLRERVTDIEKSHKNRVALMRDQQAKDCAMQKRIWEQQEKERRAKWMKTKLEEVKANTMKAIEPEVQRLVKQHKQTLIESEERHRCSLENLKLELGRMHETQVSALKERLAAEHDIAQRQALDLQAERHQTQIETLQSKHTSEKLRLEQSSRAALAQSKALYETELASLNTGIAQLKTKHELTCKKYDKDMEELSAVEKARAERELKALLTAELSVAYEKQLADSLGSLRHELEEAKEVEISKIGNTFKLDKERLVEETDDRISRLQEEIKSGQTERERLVETIEKNKASSAEAEGGWRKEIQCLRDQMKELDENWRRDYENLAEKGSSELSDVRKTIDTLSSEKQCLSGQLESQKAAHEKTLEELKEEISRTLSGKDVLCRELKAANEELSMKVESYEMLIQRYQSSR